MKILIIGGAGYIGSVLTQQLLNLGHQIRILDLFLYNNKPIRQFLGKAEILISDFRNYYVLDQALAGVNAVIHLAAIVGDRACDVNKSLTLDVNFYSAVEVAEKVKQSGVPIFIFSSTCSVYGSSDIAANETTKTNALSLYAKSKCFAENKILALSDAKMRTGVLRFGTIYGLSARMRFDLVINLLVAKAFSEGKITIFGGEQWRPFLHVKDAASSIFFLLQKIAENQKYRGEIYNVGSPAQNFQIKTIGKKIKEMIPGTELISSPENPDPRNYRANFDKFTDLGFATQHTIEDGMQEIIQFCKTKKVVNFTHTQYNNYRHLASGALRKLTQK